MVKIILLGKKNYRFDKDLWVKIIIVLFIIVEVGSKVNI